MTARERFFQDIDASAVSDILSGLAPSRRQIIVTGAARILQNEEEIENQERLERERTHFMLIGGGGGGGGEEANRSCGGNNNTDKAEIRKAPMRFRASSMVSGPMSALTDFRSNTDDLQSSGSDDTDDLIEQLLHEKDEDEKESSSSSSASSSPSTSSIDIIPTSGAGSPFSSPIADIDVVAQRAVGPPPAAHGQTAADPRRHRNFFNKWLRATRDIDGRWIGDFVRDPKDKAMLQQAFRTSLELAEEEEFDAIPPAASSELLSPRSAKLRQQHHHHHQQELLEEAESNVMTTTMSYTDVAGALDSSTTAPPRSGAILTSQDVANQIIAEASAVPRMLAGRTSWRNQDDVDAAREQLDQRRMNETARKEMRKKHHHHHHHHHHEQHHHHHQHRHRHRHSHDEEFQSDDSDSSETLLRNQFYASFREEDEQTVEKRRREQERLQKQALPRVNIVAAMRQIDSFLSTKPASTILDVYNRNCKHCGLAPVHHYEGSVSLLVRKQPIIHTKPRSGYLRIEPPSSVPSELYRDMSAAMYETAAVLNSIRGDDLERFVRDNFQVVAAPPASTEAAPTLQQQIESLQQQLKFGQHTLVSKMPPDISGVPQQPQHDKRSAAADGRRALDIALRRCALEKRLQQLLAEPALKRVRKEADDGIEAARNLLTSSTTTGEMISHTRHEIDELRIRYHAMLNQLSQLPSAQRDAVVKLVRMQVSCAAAQQEALKAQHRLEALEQKLQERMQHVEFLTGRADEWGILRTRLHRMAMLLMEQLNRGADTATDEEGAAMSNVLLKMPPPKVLPAFSAAATAHQSQLQNLHTVASDDFSRIASASTQAQTPSQLQLQPPQSEALGAAVSSGSTPTKALGDSFNNNGGNTTDTNIAMAAAATSAAGMLLSGAGSSTLDSINEVVRNALRGAFGKVCHACQLLDGTFPFCPATGLRHAIRDFSNEYVLQLRREKPLFGEAAATEWLRDKGHGVAEDETNTLGGTALMKEAMTPEALAKKVLKSDARKRMLTLLQRVKSGAADTFAELFSGMFHAPVLGEAPARARHHSIVSYVGLLNDDENLESSRFAEYMKAPTVVSRQMMQRLHNMFQQAVAAEQQQQQMGAPPSLRYTNLLHMAAALAQLQSGSAASPSASVPSGASMTHQSKLSSQMAQITAFFQKQNHAIAGASKRRNRRLSGAASSASAGTWSSRRSSAGGGGDDDDLFDGGAMSLLSGFSLSTFRAIGMSFDPIHIRRNLRERREDMLQVVKSEDAVRAEELKIIHAKISKYRTERHKYHPGKYGSWYPQYLRSQMKDFSFNERIKMIRERAQLDRDMLDLVDALKSLTVRFKMNATEYFELHGLDEGTTLQRLEVLEKEMTRQVLNLRQTMKLAHVPARELLDWCHTMEGEITKLQERLRAALDRNSKAREVLLSLDGGAEAAETTAPVSFVAKLRSGTVPLGSGAASGERRSSRDFTPRPSITPVPRLLGQPLEELVEGETLQTTTTSVGEQQQQQQQTPQPSQPPQLSAAIDPLLASTFPRRRQVVICDVPITNDIDIGNSTLSAASKQQHRQQQKNQLNQDDDGDAAVWLQQQETSQFTGEASQFGPRATSGVDDEGAGQMTSVSTRKNGKLSTSSPLGSPLAASDIKLVASEMSSLLLDMAHIEMQSGSERAIPPQHHHHNVNDDDDDDDVSGNGATAGRGRGGGRMMQDKRGRGKNQLTNNNNPFSMTSSHHAHNTRELVPQLFSFAIGGGQPAPDAQQPQQLQQQQQQSDLQSGKVVRGSPIRQELGSRQRSPRSAAGSDGNPPFRPGGVALARTYTTTLTSALSPSAVRVAESSKRRTSPVSQQQQQHHHSAEQQRRQDPPGEQQQQQQQPAPVSAPVTPTPLPSRTASSPSLQQVAEQQQQQQLQQLLAEDDEDFNSNSTVFGRSAAKLFWMQQRALRRERHEQRQRELQQQRRSYQTARDSTVKVVVSDSEPPPPGAPASAPAPVQKQASVVAIQEHIRDRYKHQQEQQRQHQRALAQAIGKEQHHSSTADERKNPTAGEKETEQPRASTPRMFPSIHNVRFDEVLQRAQQLKEQQQQQQPVPASSVPTLPPIGAPGGKAPPFRRGMVSLASLGVDPFQQPQQQHQQQHAQTARVVSRGTIQQPLQPFGPDEPFQQPQKQQQQDEPLTARSFWRRRVSLQQQQPQQPQPLESPVQTQPQENHDDDDSRQQRQTSFLRARHAPRLSPALARKNGNHWAEAQQNIRVAVASAAAAAAAAQPDGAGEISSSSGGGGETKPPVDEASLSTVLACHGLEEALGQTNVLSGTHRRLGNSLSALIVFDNSEGEMQKPLNELGTGFAPCNFESAKYARADVALIGVNMSPVRMVGEVKSVVSPRHSPLALIPARFRRPAEALQELTPVVPRGDLKSGLAASRKLRSLLGAAKKDDKKNNNKR